MNRTHRWRLTLLAIEFVSLIVLLISIYWLRQYRADHPHMTVAWLLIPGAASLTLFLSFINMTYLRLVSSAMISSAASSTKSSAKTGGALIARKVAFLVSALVLVGIWIVAMQHIWQRLAPEPASHPVTVQPSGTQ